jgi:FkbM family methyltransferase
MTGVDTSGTPPSRSDDVPAEGLSVGEFNRLRPCRHGLMLFNRNDLAIGASLDRYGEWDELELRILAQLLRPEDVVLDVGANIGTHTVFFARTVGEGGFVFSFEPQRLLFQTLCANVALNELLNVKCFEAAVGRGEGTLELLMLDPRKENNFGGSPAESAAGGETVQLVSLDSFGFPDCRLIKIDVEGAELDVLAGAARTIERSRPFLLVENNREERSPDLIEAILALEYRAYWLIHPGFHPANFRDCQENIFAGMVPNAVMLCAPKETTLQGIPEVQGPQDDWRRAAARLSGRH